MNIPLFRAKRIDILKKSLEKKEAKLNQMFEDHFKDVKSANGQPLNDKRNGRATMNRWERQNNAIARQEDEIEKTKRAIDREEMKIFLVKEQFVPNAIKELINDGVLTQWRKFPNRFFVVGVPKARIIFDEKRGRIDASYVPKDCQKTRSKFVQIFNPLSIAVAKECDAERAAGGNK